MGEDRQVDRVAPCISEHVQILPEVATSLQWCRLNFSSGTFSFRILKGRDFVFTYSSNNYSWRAHHVPDPKLPAEDTEKHITWASLVLGEAAILSEGQKQAVGKHRRPGSGSAVTEAPEKGTVYPQQGVRGQLPTAGTTSQSPARCGHLAREGQQEHLRSRGPDACKATGVSNSLETLGSAVVGVDQGTRGSSDRHILADEQGLGCGRTLCHAGAWGLGATQQVTLRWREVGWA